VRACVRACVCVCVCVCITDARSKNNFELELRHIMRAREDGRGRGEQDNRESEHAEN
jgi:hypothetical protein